MIRRPPRSTLDRSSAASDVYKRQTETCGIGEEQRAQLSDDGVPRALELARALGVSTNLVVFAEQLRAGGRSTAPIADIGCFMGYAYSRITVDGTVLYCCNTEVVVGRLSEARFGDLWRGDAWNALRARLRRGEYFDGRRHCGKLSQNVAPRARFSERHGQERFLGVHGPGGGAFAAHPRLHQSGAGTAVGAHYPVACAAKENLQSSLFRFRCTSTLGAIIVDGEHEASYKQAETPRYHARDVALIPPREAGARWVPSSACGMNREASFRCTTSPPSAISGPAPPGPSSRLLYTSPSPRNRTRSSMPPSA